MVLWLLLLLWLLLVGCAGDKKPVEDAARKLVVLRKGFKGRLSKDTLPGLSMPGQRVLVVD